MTFTKMTDRSVDASCLLGSVSFPGTGVSAISAGRPALSATLPVSERNERPTVAPVAVVAAEAQAHGAYGFAAAAGTASAGFKRQTKQTKQQHHLMWAFRGLEPWSDPA
ncbi:hypothetical protein AMK16_09645 [Streptomyces sp. CB00455]|uniref:hypothetical protein n=1 Tax=Streptomyces sp. CB00455 TaxID=1703927 RepID=UPI00093E6201|nr:hypothetical protein [Streptomyces sp. CB00455]OKK21203.1 hypothetical protein AMK16_09645 [Streptomyces sp. CB00455]